MTHLTQSWPVVIFFATTLEASATLHLLDAQLVEQEEILPSLYRIDGGWIVITGLGSHAAKRSIMRYAHLGTSVWNLGFAGVLRSQHRIGSIFPIGVVGKYPNPQPQINFSTHPHHLITSDFPIHDSALREQLAQEWDLVDMEGYGLVSGCFQLGKPCQMWKIVSDFASPGGKKLIVKHCAELSASLAEVVQANFLMLS
jgi:nucleoside phosphorylase